MQQTAEQGVGTQRLVRLQHHDYTESSIIIYTAARTLYQTVFLLREMYAHFLKLQFVFTKFK